MTPFGARLPCPFRGATALCFALSFLVSSAASADEPEPEEAAPFRTSQLSIGGHGAVLAAAHCDADLDVVNCQEPQLAAGLDLSGRRFVAPDLGLGARVAFSVGNAGSTRGSRSQWFIRLLGDVTWASTERDDGPSLTGEVGIALLVDRLVPRAEGGAPPPREGTTYLAPVLGVMAAYDFVVFERLTLGVTLSGQLMYLARVDSDTTSSFDGISDGIVPIVELGLRGSMSE